jgi:hypothetical protein
MKLTYWLVLLLAAIFPVKGAMAVAGVLCHVPASHQVQPVHDRGSHAVHDTHTTVGSHDATHHAHGADASSDEVRGVSCPACAAVCGASPLPTTGGFSLPLSKPGRDWRDFTVVEPPSESLAGLERPPRSI